MADNRSTEVIRGKTSYAKILGDPVLNYSGDGKEWKMDLEITNETKKELKALGIADRVKTKAEYLDGKPFITFRQRELRPTGEPNRPITVVDAAGNAWPEDRLIGNGSTVDVKFTVVDYGKGKMKGVYISDVRVLELVPYAKTAFEPLDETDEFYQNAQKQAERQRDIDMLSGQKANTDSDEGETEDLTDDEIPF